MSVTSSTFNIYPDQMWGGWSEVMRVNTEAFNAASNNGIVMRSELIKGDYSVESYLAAFVGSNADETGGISRRDTTADQAFTLSNPSTNEHVTIKLNRKGGAAKYLDAWKKIQADAGIEDDMLLSFYLGRMYAKDAMADYLRAIIRAAVAALQNTTVANSNFYDQSSAGRASTLRLAQGIRLYGDAAGDIVCWIMNGLAYNDIIQDNITTAVTGVAGAVMYGESPATLGLPVVVTDIDALTNTGGGTAGDSYYILGLKSNGLQVIESEARSDYNGIVPQRENLLGVMQFETAYNIDVAGTSFDRSIVNPTAVQLTNASNWTQDVSSHKDLCGILIEVDNQG